MLEHHNSYTIIAINILQTEIISPRIYEMVNQFLIFIIYIFVN